LYHANSSPDHPRLAASLLAHDQSPFSDHHESGADIGLEYLFSPQQGGFWETIGSPRIHLGGILSLQGETSILYSGLTYQFEFQNNYFFDAAVGLAAHNGPLHKDSTGCKLDSDCGFGFRVLPHFGFDLGKHLDEQHSLSLFYDHMSHGRWLNRENEGIDHLGVRYMWYF
jgi:lipid A 3-O-deacylase